METTNWTAGDVSNWARNDQVVGSVARELMRLRHRWSASNEHDVVDAYADLVMQTSWMRIDNASRGATYATR